MENVSFFLALSFGYLILRIKGHKISLPVLGTPYSTVVIFLQFLKRCRFQTYSKSMENSSLYTDFAERSGAPKTTGIDHFLYHRICKPPIC